MNFSLWCDFLERDFINSDFVALIKSGKINGATTNPAIFKTAFASPAYSADIERLKGKKSAKKIYELLAVNDVKFAASKMLTNYANGEDGFVSIEVDPFHYDDGVSSLKEGKHLYNMIKMPNVMIKIPASEHGMYAMSELVKRGINVNATLVFSLEQVRGCLKAFEDGLRAYKKKFPNQKEPECVISVFVSRFDRMLDEELKAGGLEPMKYGIYNATLAYYEIESFGLSNVRTLFASTGVKGSNAPADYYINELAFERSVNTAPLDALKAAGEINLKSPESKEKIEEYFAKAKELGIKHDKVCAQLFKDGIKAFEEAYNDTLHILVDEHEGKNSAFAPAPQTSQVDLASKVKIALELREQKAKNTPINEKTKQKKKKG